MADSPMPTHATALGEADPQVVDRRKYQRRTSTDTLVCRNCETPRSVTADGPCKQCGSKDFYGDHAPPGP